MFNVNSIGENTPSIACVQERKRTITFSVPKPKGHYFGAQLLYEMGVFTVRAPLEYHDPRRKIAKNNQQDDDLLHEKRWHRVRVIGDISACLLYAPCHETYMFYRLLVRPNLE